MSFKSIWSKIAHPFGGKGILQGAWESCQPDMNVTDEPLRPRDWSPMEFGAKIIVAGNPRRSQDVARAVMRVQTALAEQFKTDYPDTKLLMSVETFLDNCRHSTPWSDSPSDIGSRATRWHCFQTATRFHEAFAAMRTDANQRADMVILLGDRFDDDDLSLAQREALALHKAKGTRIFALPTVYSQNDELAQKYKTIAENAGGLCLPLLKYEDTDYGALMHEITQSVFAKVAGTDFSALPPPSNKETQKVRALLQKLDM